MTSKAVSRVTAKKQALRVKANIYTYKYMPLNTYQILHHCHFRHIRFVKKIDIYW